MARRPLRWLDWWLCCLLLLVPLLAVAQDMPDLFPDTGQDAPPDPNYITDEFWSTGIFTQLMGLIDRIFTDADSHRPILAAVLSFLHWIAVLEVSLTLIFLALSDDAQSLIGMMCGQLLVVGFVLEITSKFPEYVDVWLNGCIWAGITVGGTLVSAISSEPMTIEQFKDVGFIMLRGLTKLNAPYDYLTLSFSRLSWIGVIKGFGMWGPMMFAWVVAAFCFFLIGLFVLAAFVEFGIIATVATPFLPFIILKSTRQIGMVMLFSVVGAGIRLATLAALVGLMDGVMNQVTLIDPERITVGTYLAITILAILFATLAGVLPVKLAGRVSGQSMFGSGMMAIGRMVRR